ncbi:hypothetical protein [Cellulosimicrobium sp. E-16]|uniref:hypothetical protein n=1 Tax=Cellulosimicrobium sp. E-16 TaxID=3404049 RepID=UPI003CF9AAF9
MQTENESRPTGAASVAGRPNRILPREIRAWQHGFVTGDAVGYHRGWDAGYVVGFDAGIPSGRLEVETELATAGRPILDAIREATGTDLHRLEPLYVLNARRRGEEIPKPEKPPVRTRLVAGWDALWLAGAPASRFLEPVTEVAA